MNITGAQHELARIAVDLSGAPLRDVIRAAAEEVAVQARANAPVDTGALRASINASIAAEARMPGADGAGSESVVVESVVVESVVGSNLTYAPAVEYGSPPHAVPVAALEGWAERHGANVYVVQRAIARRGTRARGFLSRAVEASRGRVEQVIAEGVARIVRNG